MKTKYNKTIAGAFAVIFLVIAALPAIGEELIRYSPGIPGSIVMMKETTQPQYNYDYNILWQQTLHEGWLSGGLRNAIDSDNNIIVSGVNEEQKGLLIKLDTNGNVIWDTTVIPSSEATYLSEYFAMPLERDSGDPELTYAMVQKTLNTINTISGDYPPLDVVVDSQNNILASGVLLPEGSDIGDMGIAVLVKYDTTGNMLWNKSYNFLPPSSENYTWCFGLTVDSEDNAILPVFAVRDNMTSPFLCSFVLKISPDGDIIWIAPRLAALYDDATVDSSDNVYACGMFYLQADAPMVITKFSKNFGVRLGETTTPITGTQGTFLISIKTDTTTGKLYTCGATIIGDGEGVFASFDTSLNLLNLHVYTDIPLITDLAFLNNNDIVISYFSGYLFDNYKAAVAGKSNGALKLLIDLGESLHGGILGLDDYTKGVSVDHNGDAIVTGGRGGIVTHKIHITIISIIPPIFRVYEQAQQQLMR